jgi:hypothetical protein
MSYFIFMLLHKNGIIIFGILGLLLVLIAFCSYLIVKDVDTNYSGIVSSEVKLQKAIHLLERDFNNIQRSMLNMLLIADSLEIGKIKMDALDAAKRMDNHIDNMEPLKSTQRGQELLARLTQHSLQYRQACASFIVLIDSKDNKNAIAVNKKELYPSLLSLQNDQEEIVDYIGSTTIKNSDKITSAVTKLGAWTIGISSFPVTVWVVGGLTVLTLLFMSFYHQKQRDFQQR